ncbi:MAG TPA: hypothetical protein VGC27_08870, partial [Rhizomicrobium sp.]
AQTVPGENVIVNPSAAGTRVLRYPGDKYVRIVPPLRQPGEATEPIRLRMPASHRVVRSQAPREASAAPVAAPAPPKQTNTNRSNFDDLAVVRPAAPAPAPARPEPSLKPAPVRTPPPQRAASAEPPPQRAIRTEPQRTIRAEPPLQRMARTEPPPMRTPAPASNPEADSGSKRGVVLFAPNATDPSVSAMQNIKTLAGSLSTTLGVGASRLQLLAFGGPHGEKSSDSRRLSLRRALIVRQILIDNGVPSERIDVRAMGGTDDSGPLDRVDVFLKR